MGYFKKKEIERMDNYKLREAEDFEDGVDRYPMPHIPTEEEIEDTKQDTTWSIKHEGHLNRNNIIFHTNKYQKLYQKMKKVDDKLKEHRMSNAEKAFDLQEKIAKLIDKLDELGFEYMYYNSISSIRRKRDYGKRKTDR
jgi:hypothetical protein